MPKRTRTNPPQPTAHHHRRRVYAACSECRRRRRKCDGRRPCAQCQSYGYACAYSAGPAAAASTQPSPAATASPTEPARRAAAAPAPPSLVATRERGGRFVHAHSAVALPHLVGQALALAPPLRLHSYAWNLGVRPERRPRSGSATPRLSDYATLAECRALCDAYFAAVHPVFPLLPRAAAFTRRVAQTWASLDAQPNFAAAVALVAALGSVFSGAAAHHPREEDMQRLGVGLLDEGMARPRAAVDRDAAAAWVLRALYARATTRPALACVASQTAVHVAEIAGLHRDPAPAAEGMGWSAEECEERRRCFCAARFVNLLLAAEYGVSPAVLRLANCAAPAGVPGAHIDVLHALSGVLQDADDAADAGLDSDEFAGLFQRLQDIPRDDDTVALFTGDVCLCLLRRFTAPPRRPGPHIAELATAILQRALDGVANLLSAEHARAWWNVLGVPFQSVCVAVAADDLLALLPPAMGVLRAAADRFGTHMAREALAAAQQLVGASRAGTEARLAVKEEALARALPAVEDVDWTGFDEGGDWLSMVDFFM